VLEFCELFVGGFRGGLPGSSAGFRYCLQFEPFSHRIVVSFFSIYCIGLIKTGEELISLSSLVYGGLWATVSHLEMFSFLLYPLYITFLFFKLKKGKTLAFGYTVR
jgi:hypothetical protein